MVMVFIIWTACSFLLMGIGTQCLRSKDAVKFFSVGEAPKIVKGKIQTYNHAVARLWFAYAILLELLGIPFLFFKQNSPVFLLSIVGVVFLTLGLIIFYSQIAERYSK